MNNELKYAQRLEQELERVGYYRWAAQDQEFEDDDFYSEDAYPQTFPWEVYPHSHLRGLSCDCYN